MAMDWVSPNAREGEWHPPQVLSLCSPPALSNQSSRPRLARFWSRLRPRRSSSPDWILPVKPARRRTNRTSRSRSDGDSLQEWETGMRRQKTLVKTANGSRDRFFIVPPCSSTRPLDSGETNEPSQEGQILPPPGWEPDGPWPSTTGCSHRQCLPRPAR